jgi:hypothetical protein
VLIVRDRPRESVPLRIESLDQSFPVDLLYCDARNRVEIHGLALRRKDTEFTLQLKVLAYRAATRKE